MADDWGPVFIEVSRMRESDRCITTLSGSPEPYGPDTWLSAVGRLEDSRGRSECLICRKLTTESPSTREEHVILQGLGPKWAALSAGFVCDNCNNGCSDSERRFLRQGLMSFFRPFYLRENKAVEFNDPSGRTVVFRNIPGEGFRIELTGLTGLPDKVPQPSSGTVSFKVPVEYPDPIHVSRALHKMALLALAVAAPEVGLSEALNDSRAFVAEPSDEIYRPFSEMFVCGAAPGFDFRYLVSTQESSGSVRIDLIMVMMRLHHCIYGLSLVGGYQSEHARGEYFREPRVKRGKQIVELIFGFDAMNPDEECSQ